MLSEFCLLHLHYLTLFVWVNGSTEYVHNLTLGTNDNVVYVIEFLYELHS